MKERLGALLLLLVGCSSPEPAAPLVDLTDGKPNVIVIVLDTVRADHLGAYGATGVQTPNLDAFAADAILFEDAASTSTWTLPSVASLYTGREPQFHRAIGAKFRRVDEELPVLPEILQTRGYSTWGFVAVDFMAESFGMDRGFDDFSSRLHGPVSKRFRGYQGQVSGTLSVPPVEPWFGLVHLFDAHDPYRPPKPFDRMYYEGDPAVLPEDPAQHLSVIYGDTNRIQQDPRRRYAWLSAYADLMFPVKQYAAGITHVDDLLGNVFRRLEETGRYEDSIIVVLADHGEHLTEHDIYFTHRFPYAEVLQVPLMIRLPGAVQAGRRVPDPVSLVDVLPTLMELIGEPLESPVDGVSLVPAMRGDTLSERLLFAEYGTGNRSWAKAVWNDEWRFVEILDDDVRTAELFDRAADPREENDLASERPEVVETLRAALDLHFGPERRWIASDDGEAVPIDEATAERLRALGYID